jgi:large subunit ribosomal protein L10
MLPSREELYAKVVGSISAPLSGMVNVLAGNIRGLVSVLKQYQEKVS